MMIKRENTLRRYSGCGLVVALVAIVIAQPPAARADVKLPAIFGSHMVLQRDQKDRVWGWAEPGEEVTVKIAGQSQDRQGRRRRRLAGHARPDAGRRPAHPDDRGQEHGHVRRRARRRGLDLLGAVEHAVVASRASKDADLEIADGQVPQDPADHGAQRRHAGAAEGLPRRSGSPAGRIRSAASRPSATSSVASCTRRSDVPVGLINDAWGGSACEAWIRRDILAADAKYAPMLQRWEELEKDYPRAKEEYQAKYAAWKEAATKAKAENKPEPQQPFESRLA